MSRIRGPTRKRLVFVGDDAGDGPLGQSPREPAQNRSPHGPVHGVQGLVEEEMRRPADERGGEGGPAFLSQRQLADRTSAEAFQADRGERFDRRPGRFPSQAGDEPQDIADGGVRRQVGLLGT